MGCNGKVARGCIASLFTVALVCITGREAPAQNIALGEQIFTEKAVPSCALCHTLKAANSSGTIGPNLDELKPDLDKISRAVKNGVGNMPPYDDTLSDAEIEAVSRYVAEAVGARR